MAAALDQGLMPDNVITIFFVAIDIFDEYHISVVLPELFIDSTALIQVAPPPETPETILIALPRVDITAIRVFPVLVSEPIANEIYLDGVSVPLFPVAVCTLVCPATFPVINKQSKASSINLPGGVNVFILSVREVIRFCHRLCHVFWLLQTVKLFIFNYFTND